MKLFIPPEQGMVDGVVLCKSLLRIWQIAILELCLNLGSAEGGPELNWLFALEKVSCISLHKKMEN